MTTAPQYETPPHLLSNRQLREQRDAALKQCGWHMFVLVEDGETQLSDYSVGRLFELGRSAYNLETELRRRDAEFVGTQRAEQFIAEAKAAVGIGGAS